MPAEVQAYVTGEQIMIKHLLASSGSLQRRRDEASLLAHRNAPPFTPPVPHADTEQLLMKVAQQTLITGATHLLSTKALQFGGLPARPVMDEHIAAARAYTSQLLGVNLDAVEVVVAQADEWDLPVAEGATFFYTVDQHLVFVPPTFSAPTELLCHELGHAAHATARRQTEALPFYLGAAVTEEFVAMFSQFNYILAHGSRREFLEALGTLGTASFALSMWSQGPTVDFDDYLGTPHGAEFLKAIAVYNLSYQFSQFAQHRDLYLNQVHRGVAMLLALLLIDEHEGMRRFIALDRVDHSLVDKLAAAFPGFDLDAGLARINEQIAALVARFPA